MSASPSSADRFPQLEKYELIEEIGHGGMATVYRARDLRLDRDVAVKVIHKHLRENPEVRRRFVSEAKAVAKLRHPAIVDVYDVADDEDIERFLVVELIRGGTLRQLLQDHTVLPAEIAAIMVARLCDAVEHAHEHGVIHRDIKPENVMLELPSEARRDSLSGGSEPPPRISSERSRTSVRLKLTDFGIAKVLDAQGVTSTGQILGSPAHMAPEQIEGGDIGPHTDVFALGVLLYECMVGHLPFEGKNPAQVLRGVLEGSFEPAESERPEVGGRWSRILAAALATQPEERIQRATELGEQISEELADLGIDDPDTELVAFFADPQEYERDLHERLVPRLLERGESARKAGRVPLAAADFNRALALRPGDLAILKRVSSLSARTLWRERAVRGTAILVGSLVLGGGAFGVTRWLKAAEPAVSTARLADTAALVSEPAPAPQKTSEPAPPPEPTARRVDDTTEPKPAPTAFVSPPPVTAQGTAKPAEEPDERLVRFQVNPGGAHLEVDGNPVSDWWAPRRMTVGAHRVRGHMEDACCEDITQTIQVSAPPEDDPDAVETHAVFLTIKPARFVLRGGPSGATVICRGAMATEGSPGELPMSNSLEWRGSCQFTDPQGAGRTATVTLRAGKTTAVSWPGS